MRFNTSAFTHARETRARTASGHARMSCSRGAAQSLVTTGLRCELQLLEQAPRLLIACNWKATEAARRGKCGLGGRQHSGQRRHPVWHPQPPRSPRVSALQSVSGTGTRGPHGLRQRCDGLPDGGPAG